MARLSLSPTSLLPIFVLGAALLAGCDLPGAEGEVTGVWTVDRKLSHIPSIDEEHIMFGGRRAAREERKRLQLVSPILKIRRDYTYVMTGVLATSGTWKMTGDKVVLTPIPKADEEPSMMGMMTQILGGDPRTLPQELTYDAKTHRLRLERTLPTGPQTLIFRQTG